MSLLTLSLGCGLLILLILLTRKALARRLPRRVITVLWAVCALRLIIPFSLELPVLASEKAVCAAESAEVIIPVDSADDIAAIAPYESGVRPSSDQNDTMVEPNASPREKVVKFPLKACLVAVWLLGAAAMLAFFGHDLVKSLRKIGKGRECTNPYALEWLDRCKTLRRIRVRVCDNIGSPLTYGVFRPVIVITKAADSSTKETLNYILTHEYMHIRYFDSALILVLALALCLHWFNPLVWIMFKAAAKDIELACDEDVIHTLGRSKRAGYAKTLILTEAGASSLLLSDLKTSTIEERIVAIMKYKKLSALSVTIAAAIAVTTALCAFTKPVAKEQDEIVRTTVRQEPDVTVEPIYLSYPKSIAAKIYGYQKANVLWDDSRSLVKQIAASDFSGLNTEDYTELEPDENGICYLKISDAKQFAFKGKVIVTDDDGKPFLAEYNKGRDHVSLTISKSGKFSSDSTMKLGFISGGEIIKKSRFWSKNDYCNGTVGLTEEFDKDTEIYCFLESDETVYMDCIEVSLSAIGVIAGGSEMGKYYIDGVEVSTGASKTWDAVVEDIYLENAYNIGLGNSVDLCTSESLLKDLKAGQKVQVIVDLDLENYEVPDPYKWTDPETGEVIYGKRDGATPRWQIGLYKNNGNNLAVSSTVFPLFCENYDIMLLETIKNQDANVIFEIPEGGDYVIHFNNAGCNVLKVISTEVKIID